MRMKIRLPVLLLLVITSLVYAQSVERLHDAIIWTFGGHLTQDTLVTLALYFDPEFMKRGWFRYSSIPYNCFPELEWVADRISAHGAILEGGVQSANILPHAGWPCAHEADSSQPYSFPPPVYNDLETRNTSDSIYYIPNLGGSRVAHVSIANENWLSYCLWWAYEQIDAGAEALEFDEISGAYRLCLDTTVAVEDNSNDGYEDYSLGTANLCRKLSLVCRRDGGEPMDWFLPTPSASSNSEEAHFAFDGNFSTAWNPDYADSHWLEIDLRRSRRIRQIYLAFPSADPLASFEVRWWDGSSWQSFSPPISITDNTDSISSFLVATVWTTKLRLTTDVSEPCISEFQAFGCGFRQFVLQRFYADSGWTPSDPRWESMMLVNLSDTAQCPDGTMNSFNYRKYLEYHNWAKNPFGCTPTRANAFNPCNPFFLIWLPRSYVKQLVGAFYDYPGALDSIFHLYERSFSHFRTRQLFWQEIVDSVRAYSDAIGKNVFISYNGSYFRPDSAVDYLIYCIGKCPSYPAPSETDTQKTHLDARRVYLANFRWLKREASEYVGRDLPMVAFMDFGHMGFPFYHLGGSDEPADQRAAFLQVYVAEMYAAGLRFAYPLTGNEGYYIWLDSLTDGRTVAEIAKTQADFFKAHGAMYKDVVVNDMEGLVRINGVVPYNGDTLEPSYANETGVAVAYLSKLDSNLSYLHIINHNWDTVSHRLLTQHDLSVEIPVSDSVETLYLISPDFFPDTIYPAFSLDDTVLTLMLDSLQYYLVVVISYDEAVGINEERWSLSIPSLSAYPNPFNSVCHISINLPRGSIFPRIEVFDILGRKVDEFRLRKGEKEALWIPDKQSSGIYFFCMEASERRIVEKVIYLR